jgi:hypothetical protein
LTISNLNFLEFQDLKNKVCKNTSCVLHL